MSKKPRRTATRAAAKAALRKPRPTATKRPPAEPDTAERMVCALEAIARHLSAASRGSDFSSLGEGSLDRDMRSSIGRCIIGSLQRRKLRDG